MPRYKPTERNGLLLPVVLSEQIVDGSFEFALSHLVDHELDLSTLDAKFRDDETGASAYDLRVMLRSCCWATAAGCCPAGVLRTHALPDVSATRGMVTKDGIG